MNAIFLTQDDGKIIGWVTRLLGAVMNVIFNIIDAIGLPNVGLAIILFTLVVNLLMLPLTMKQQKFSKLNAKMNPEIQAIRDKYKGRTDQNSQMAMNQEIQEIYTKYGVSPTGSCLQLLIQMPILFALYRVIASIPAYVTKIKDAFLVLADKIIAADGAEFLRNSGVDSIKNTVSMYGQKMVDGNMQNGVIDVLNKLSSADMNVVAEHYDLTNLMHQGELILSNETTRGLIDTYNNFLGLNIGNSPSYIVKEAFAAGTWGLIIGAILIPVLSAVTQWVNVKLMPQQNSDTKKSAEEDAMMSSMKTMNMVMPLMSAWLCYTLPCGMGLYWVAGSVVRGVLQVVVNKHLDKMDFDEIVKKNEVKSAKKIEKMKQQQELINAYANMNTKKIQSRANMPTGSDNTSGTKKPDIKKDTEKDNSTNSGANVDYGRSYKPGSMMAKANMVKEFNERNNKN